MPYTDRVNRQPTMIATFDNAFRTLIRVAIRSILIQRGPHTCSDLVREMGLDPRNHKGTIHAILVQLETQGVIAATRNDRTGKRDLWFTLSTGIRKRDRVAALILG